ncbi:SDR family NAD(P)-dependent oxidoreductase [Parendozoicomonas sp. Alg238-R29]|uniref:SDR family NAD(P)-dependent oxidoreductase n=1 Tax=Parendozoicomonas sp. Alg238-R29 TaxID=2993446 RepID=UPI00248EE5E4|nr:SDR family NAD(P)-dependent oxidoreductase [Parendozoicomonas sp. Alg238-R29]
MKKSILITGASSGIGAETAKLFSQKGYKVFAGYRNENDAKSLALLENVTPIKLDVTIPESVERAVATISTSLGENGLYALINNAGITYTAPFEYADEKKMRYVMDVNVWGVMNLTQKCIPLMKKFNEHNSIKSRVVNITSWAGILGQPFNGAYNASKFAIIGLSEAMYYDLGLLDIHVISASPGVTKTPLLKKTTDASQAYSSMPDKGKAFYQKHIDNLDSMSEASNNSSALATPKKIAQKLFIIVEKKKPDMKQNMAVDAKIMNLLRRLIPFSWLSGMFKGMYSLK